MVLLQTKDQTVIPLSQCTGLSLIISIGELYYGIVQGPLELMAMPCPEEGSACF